MSGLGIERKFDDDWIHHSYRYHSNFDCKIHVDVDLVYAIEKDAPLQFSIYRASRVSRVESFLLAFCAAMAIMRGRRSTAERRRVGKEKGMVLPTHAAATTARDELVLPWRPVPESASLHDGEQWPRLHDVLAASAWRLLMAGADYRKPPVRFGYKRFLRQDRNCGFRFLRFSIIFGFSGFRF